jgi:hypothetical protein
VLAAARAAARREAVDHVQLALGDETLMHVVDLDPDSRLPERRSVLVPRPHAREGGGEQ